MTDVPALRVSDLHKGFGIVTVLDGLDLTVDTDELVALVGENGVGKTTLVRCLAGMMSADLGTIAIHGQTVRTGVPRPGELEVVWQDLALCENLDVVDNLFLGREDSWILASKPDLQLRAAEMLDQLGITIADLARPVSSLSGGQRQSVALARTLVTNPSLLVLDEPTSALDSGGIGAVEALIRLLRAKGTAILLISHNLELVCQVADRVLVLRGGRITADVRRPALAVDELRARMSGIESDAMARQQLHGLRSLVEQLADVKPSAVLPLILSAMSVALEQDRVALHLVSVDDEGRRDGPLRFAAGLGLGAELRSGLQVIDAHPENPHGQALSSRGPVVLRRVGDHDDPWTAKLLRLGVRSMWTVPLIGTKGVLGTLSGYGEAVGDVGPDVLELAALYASHAAAALDRDGLLRDVTRRNQTLETLRQMLETLAGPDDEDVGMSIALDALRRGLGAQDIALVDHDTDALTPGTAPGAARNPARDGARRWTVRVQIPPGRSTWLSDLQFPIAGHDLATGDQSGRVILATTVAEHTHSRTIAVRWGSGSRPAPGSADLLTDGARSLLLALERDAHEEARREAVALRRSNSMQQRFLARVSHELRTPLTAIHGYADTLRQPDVEWDHSSTRRFLDTIVHESGRLGDLVGDLLDASAIEAEVLRLQLDWCEVPLVVDAAAACVPTPAGNPIVIDVPSDLPPLRCDHDRLEQVLVNLLVNAVQHTPAGTTVTVTAAMQDADHLRIAVADDGPGVPVQVLDSLWSPGVRGRDGHDGAGLGLTIALGIAQAHDGRLTVETGEHGTVFCLCLPLAGPDTPTAEWRVSDEVQG